MKNAETSPIPSVFYFFKSTYSFYGKNNEIKVILLSILVLRFLATFPCGFAVFAEILCGLAVSGTPLKTRYFFLLGFVKAYTYCMFFFMRNVIFKNGVVSQLRLIESEFDRN